MVNQSRHSARLHPVFVSLHPVLWRLIVCCLTVVAAISFCACSDVGEYDAAEITRLVEAYYNEKYDEDATVVDISEETESGLFGTSSLNNFFCTMSDGSVVYYDRGDERADDLFKDNRQTTEILELYSNFLHDFEQKATQRFIDAGYTASVELDDLTSIDIDELSKSIAYEEWESKEKDFSGSYFHTKLESQGDDYVLEERPYSTIRVDSCNAYISGPDAEYVNAFPTNVPETPAWQAAANAVVQDFESFSGAMSHIEVYQAPDGTRDSSEVQLGDGFINGYDNAWIICDYIALGDGIWVSSGEYGLRYGAADFVLTESDTPTLEELIADGSTPKNFTSTAYKAYMLKFADGAAARAESKLEEVGTHGGGWVELDFAFDTASVTYSDGSAYENTVRLYSVEVSKNANTGAATDGGRSASKNTGQAQTSEPKYELSRITYSEEPLPNGMISGREALYFEDALSIVRM